MLFAPLWRTVYDNRCVTHYYSVMIESKPIKACFKNQPRFSIT